MFTESYVANGSFSQNCQRKSILQTLVSLVIMILEGPKAKCQSTGKPGQAALTLAQLLKFDSVKHTQKTEKCTGHVKRDSITSVHWCDASFKNTQGGSYKQIIFTWHVNFVRWSAMLIIRYGTCSLWTLQGDGYNIPSQAAKKRFHYSRSW